MKDPLVLVAFGGNALVERGEDATQRVQISRAEQLAGTLAAIVEKGSRLLLVHGNGPQVGDALLRVESAIYLAPPLSLDMCVAESQGSIGFVLETALRNALAGRRGAPEPVTVITQVLVKGSDPRLRRPTKPVGPFFPRYRASEMRRRLGWRLVEVEDRGFRRVVPSPRPVEVLGLDAISTLLRRERIVVAAGGGGIPVVRTRQGLRGVEAVIDKDRTASLLARRLRVDLFVILTNVDGIYENWGGENMQLITELTLSQARRGLRRGDFPAGSMGPKVEAASDYVKETGREVLITSARCLTLGLAGRAGTRIVPDRHPGRRTRAPLVLERTAKAGGGRGRPGRGKDGGPGRRARSAADRKSRTAKGARAGTRRHARRKRGKRNGRARSEER